METWDLSVNWAKKSGGYISKCKKLKPYLISLVIEKIFDSSFQLSKH